MQETESGNMRQPVWKGLKIDYRACTKYDKNAIVCSRRAYYKIA